MISAPTIYDGHQQFAEEADRLDPLAAFRQRFIIPTKDGREQIYLLGNSLGLQPRNTAAAVNGIMDQWASLGVESFFEGDKPWLQLHDELKAPLARIVGALPSEVVVMNQLTANLHLLLSAFYRPQGERNLVICEAKAFPSDKYMLASHIRQRGFDPAKNIIQVAPRAGEFHIREEDIVEAIITHRDRLALVFFGGVNYYSGQLFDMAAITAAAHEAGAIAGFDLAHAAGNVDLQLHNWSVDFAAWCSYKYLNSGPGAVAGVFVHEKYSGDKNISRPEGWWGCHPGQRFAMKEKFEAAPGADAWQLSTPPIMLLAAHREALAIFEEAGINNIVQKNAALSDFLISALIGIDENIIQIITPSHAKGAQVSLLIKERGRELFNYLRGCGIFADWREPNVIRVAPAALYNTFTEVYRFSMAIKTFFT